MNQESTTVTLGRSEALVLFELLADFDRQNCIAIGSDAERLALLRLHAALESTLVEPLTPEYQARMDEARRSLTGLPEHA